MHCASDTFGTDRGMFEMRELALVVILRSLASSATAADRATVRDLGQIIAASRGKSDKEVARQISRLVLTERLSTVQLDRLRSQLPGDTSRLALLAIADASVFLDLPRSEERRVGKEC